MIVYIAGPISGHKPEKVAPLFAQAQEKLTQAGHQVVNPMVISYHYASWKEAMKNDLKALMECDAIYLLPGWRTSAGAFLEYQVAVAFGLRVLHQLAGESNVMAKALADAIHVELGLRIERLKSRSRDGDVVKARHMYVSLLAESTYLGLADIGKEIDRNHSTVIHSLKTAKNLAETDKAFRAGIIRVKDQFYTNLKQYEEVCNEQGERG